MLGGRYLTAGVADVIVRSTPSLISSPAQNQVAHQGEYEILSLSSELTMIPTMTGMILSLAGIQ